jgi:hypothetical protein
LTIAIDSLAYYAKSDTLDNFIQEETDPIIQSLLGSAAYVDIKDLALQSAFDADIQDIRDTLTQYRTEIDDLKPVFFSTVISSDAENNITVSFPLTATTKVFYNGSIVPQSLWTGVGTTTINLLLDTRKHDEIIINK